MGYEVSTAPFCPFAVNSTLNMSWWPARRGPTQVGKGRRAGRPAETRSAADRTDRPGQSRPAPLHGVSDCPFSANLIKILFRKLHI